MKSKFISLFFSLSFSFCVVTSIFSKDIKIQRILNTESYNQNITQDKDGMLWIATERNGLFCYDGKDLKKVKIYDEYSVRTIYSIFVDREGIIWFLIEGEGLYSFDKERGIFKKNSSDQRNQNSLTSNSVHWLPCNIAEDKEGLIWIGTIDGLNSYDKKTNKFIQYKYDPDNHNSLSNNSVCTVFVDKEGLIWVGTEDGLNRYDKNAGKFYCYKHDPNNSNSISDSYIRAITEDKEGNLWIGTKRTGIDNFDKKTGHFTNYRHDPSNKNSVSYNEIHHIMVDRYNNLWICNEGNVGLDIYNIKTNTFKHYNYDLENPNSLSSNARLYSFEDNSGIVWLIDDSGGFNKCTWGENIFNNYIYNPKDNFSISSNGVAKVYEDKKGNIWVGTYRGGMCLYIKGDKFENFNHNSSPFSLPGVSVHSILNASDNKLWLGVKEGFVCLFDINTKQVIKSFQNPYFTLTPAYLTQDNQNPDLLWFACSHASGVFKFNTITGEFTRYKNIPDDISSVSNKSTTNLLQYKNILWIGTGGDGLCKFNKITEKCTYYKHDSNDKNSISGNIVIESFVDSKGNFWVTTDDGGLNKFDTKAGKFTHYGIECGFPSNSTRHILEDNESFLWISTDSGIVKFDPEKMKVIKWFTTTDGLSSNQFHKIACPIRDYIGNFWFPTLKGLCKFNPDEANKIKSNPHIPPIVLSSFKSKEENCNEDGIKKITDIKLPWPDNSFEFTFVALDYTDPEKNQYAYKLEGFENSWNYIGINNFGRYTNIPPGEYTLRLKGSNNDGLWNEEGISIKITIMPPFWMTWWFKGLVAMAVLCTIGGLFQLRARALKRVYMRDHAIAEVAAQVAHDIRSPLAALNTALRHLKGLSEQERILVRNAARRINDIANNLLLKYKAKGNKDAIKNGAQNNIKAELVSSLLDHLISEKRLQLTEKSIDIVLKSSNNTHSCFVNLEPEKFKRAISNLINNAAEAIETRGIIRVVLTKQDNDLAINIVDSGKGIPEDILSKIKRGEKTSSKKEGCGLGVASAIENIKSWNGSYDIQSKAGEGTTFTITLPIAKDPDWFQSNIILSQDTRIIILDDDESIHNIWQTRLSEYVEKKMVALDHFYEPLAFTKYCDSSRSDHNLFLVDHELIGAKESGLDLIEQLDLKKQAILVTSRYEEPEIRERIKNLGIKIIPKNFAPYIPISMEIEPVKEEQIELIFIDDDKTLTEAWEMHASFVKKKIATFNRSEDFKRVMTSYNKDILIYIDSDLKEQIPGEVFAKSLYEQGFHNLYLATGYEKDKFGDIPWIKDIVTKDAPF